MKWFNNFLSKTVPLMPKFMVGMVAKKYIAGTTLQQAVQEIKKLNEKKFLTTTDVLGENIPDIEAAQKPVKSYLELIETIRKEELDSGISVKLSQLGLTIDEEQAWKNFETIMVKAQEKQVFLRIDMEDSPWTDQTLGFYRRLRQIYPNTGTVIQAYLFRSLKDVQHLIAEAETNLRICKGIYKEPADISFQDHQKINDNFFSLVKYCLENETYVGIATHDLDLIERCEQYIKDNKIPRDKYEFQALLGVP